MLDIPTWTYRCPIFRQHHRMLISRFESTMLLIKISEPTYSILCSIDPIQIPTNLKWILLNDRFDWLANTCLSHNLLFFWKIGVFGDKNSNLKMKVLYRVCPCWWLSWWYSELRYHQLAQHITNFSVKWVIF